MPDDDRRPRITRTNSLFPGANRTPSRYTQQDPPDYNGPYQPGLGRPGDRWVTPQGRVVQGDTRDYRVVGSADTQERRSYDSPSFYSRFLDDQLRTSRTRSAITGPSTALIEVSGEQSGSLLGALDAVPNPDQTFLFDRGPVVDPATGKRTGVLQHRGVYGSADSLERNVGTPGQDVKTGPHENFMTISAGVLWLRNLAARDKDAYNKLVVMLRNAGYPGLSANDAELPLNGYTQQAGVAFALAANDLAQANQGGDTRTLMEYLVQRGQGYVDYLAQQEADRAAEEAYIPAERRYQDPATVRAAAKSAAIDALGRRLTPEEEARFEAAFRAQEDSFYDQLDVAREGETKFAAYAPDLPGQVDDFIDGEQYDTERAANKIGELSQVFMQMMGAGG